MSAGKEMENAETNGVAWDEDDDYYKINEEQKVTLNEFRQRLKDVLKPCNDDYDLLRWLRARNFNLDKAEKMFRDNVKFRKNLNLDSITADHKLPEVFEKYYSMTILGTDKHGDIVLLNLVGQCDVKGLVRCFNYPDYMKLQFSVIEKALAIMREKNKNSKKKGRRLAMISDFEGFNVFNFMDRQVLKYSFECTKAFEANYPEILKKGMSVNVSSYFVSWWNMMKVFLDPKTTSKISYYRKDDNWKEELLKHIDADILPAFLGGTLTDPDGNPNCLTLLVREPKIPTSYYLNPDTVELEPGATAITIPSGSFYNYALEVKEVKSSISWYFQTREYNIKFGIYLALVESDIRTSGKEHAKNVKKQLNSDSFEVIVPLQQIECHNIPERGEMFCTKKGKYILHFDNTFSLMTAKQLSFKAEVIPPSEALKF